jgi:hypothetical protein
MNFKVGRDCNAYCIIKSSRRLRDNWREGLRSVAVCVDQINMSINNPATIRNKASVLCFRSSGLKRIILKLFRVVVSGSVLWL